MDAFADKLGRIGAWCGQNKYLGAIKNAFQNFMPATIAGAIGVLWTQVLVNNDVINGNAQGLGGIFPPIMALEVLNPIFAAIQFATISCISIGIVMLVAQEIGEANGETGAFSAVLGFLAWLVVTPTTTYVWESVLKPGTLTSYPVLGYELNEVTKLREWVSVEALTKVEGINSSYTGATGLFTALIVGILALELYGWLRRQEALKIKMPEQVPPGVARAFEILIPAFITLVIVGGIGHACFLGTGLYLNDIISKYIQEPLSTIIGSNLIAVMFMYVLISLFWLVGMHGNNMLAAVKEPIFKPMLYANTAIFTGENTGKMNTFNITMMQMFAEWGGSGVTLGLVIAIFIFGKREDNRAIATLSVVPGLFNINETVTFGIPLVLNPILGIPFIIAPVACIALGWALIEMNFCPPVVLEVPWTMPPLLMGFLATGGSFMGAVSQLIAIVLATLIYIPFVIFYERYQNKQVAEA